MNNEPNKPIEAEELTEKELEGIVGGIIAPRLEEVSSGLPSGQPTGQPTVQKAEVAVELIPGL